MLILESWGTSRESNTGGKLRITHERITNLEAPVHNPVMRRDNWAQIVIHISGDVNYTTPFERNKADVLDIFTTSMGENYCVDWGKTEAYERYVIYFMPQLLYGIYDYDEDRKTALSFLDHKKYSSLIKLPNHMKDELTCILNDIDPILGGINSNASISVCTAAMRIFDMLYRVVSAYDMPQRALVANDLVSQALRFADENFADITGINEVAEKLHISPDHLSRKFKAAVGISLKEYITDKKLHYSHYLLKLGYNVTEAALSSGFSGVSYFIKLYKKKFGITPSRTADE